MDERGIADRIAAMSVITVDEVLEYIETTLKRYASPFEISRIYSQSGVGGAGVHFDIGSGDYTVWVELDDSDVVLEVAVFGEGAPEIDDVCLNILDDEIIESMSGLKRLFRKFFNKLTDAEDEARFRVMMDEEN